MRSFGPQLLLATVVLLLALAAGEVWLRTVGPAPPRPKQRPDDPTLIEPDSQLGWRNKPGRHVVPPYSPGAPPIRVEFLADGSRRSAAEPSEGTPLLVLGGSFAQGFAISDEETLAWKLQERFPGSSVRNFGSGGYGTLQSLLVLEREVAAGLRDPIVVYAFSGHHTTRNVAPWHWKRSLQELSTAGQVDVPSASLDADGGLVLHPAAPFAAWPLANRFRLVRLAQASFEGLRSPSEAETNRMERRVTEAILLRLNEVAREANGALIVALLSAARDKGRWLQAFATSHGIELANCNAFPLTRAQIVIGEGHPNGAMNSQWARCVGDVLESHFAVRAAARAGA